MKKIKFISKTNPTLTDILINPIITEKATGKIENEGIYSFKVAKWADRKMVKAAVELIFNVTVERVSILNTKAITKNIKNREVTISGYKKAMVKVKKDEMINMAAI